jgi:hypothetical protein
MPSVRHWFHANPDFINAETPEPLLDNAIHCNLTPEEKEREAQRSYGVPREMSHQRAEPATFCSEWVEDVPPYGPCNRKIQDEELGMCGVHARHKREGMKASERTARAGSYRRYHDEEVEEILRQLEKVYGIKIRMETKVGTGPDGGYGYTGFGHVNIGQLFEVLNVITKNTHL